MRRLLNRSSINSILIVKLSAIGDVVHTLPLVEVLRKNYPKARIDWLIEEEAGRLIEGHEDIDKIIVSKRKSWQGRLLRFGQYGDVVREISSFLKELRQREYDLVVDLQGLFKSGLLTGLTRGKRKIGFSGGREGSSFFLTEKPYPFDYSSHALERYLTAAEYLGCRVDSWKGEIPFSQSTVKAVDLIFEKEVLEPDKTIAVNPMARWITKLWEPEKFGRLADMIQRELDLRIVFTGGPRDRSHIREIIKSMEETPVDLAGRTTLKELACLYSRCRLLISTDTGPMHIAAAMGCPVIAIFGPTAPWRTGPHGEGHMVIREEIECSPCFKKRCSHMTCMKGVTVEKVFNAVKSLLHLENNRR